MRMLAKVCRQVCGVTSDLRADGGSCECPSQARVAECLADAVGDDEVSIG